MCQFDDKITEYLECTKLCYKDMVSVAKDSDSGEIRPTSVVFRIGSIKGADYLKCQEHPQNFFYVIVDPQSWHVSLCYNLYVPGW